LHDREVAMLKQQLQKEKRRKNRNSVNNPIVDVENTTTKENGTTLEFEENEMEVPGL